MQTTPNEFLEFTLQEQGRHSAFHDLGTRFGAGRRDAGEAFDERKVGPERLRGRWSVGKRVREDGHPPARRARIAHGLIRGDCAGLAPGGLAIRRRPADRLTHL
jgi:hypothetical protein